jgi:trehalose-phosphatase
MIGVTEWVDSNLALSDRWWLFLDYDGTLSEFAPTPEYILPNPTVVNLLTRIARITAIRTVILSGRRSTDLEALIPVAGIFLASTYGIEFRTPKGERVSRADYPTIRPSLESLKTRWLGLIGGSESFYLEDKGWALALHVLSGSCDRVEQVMAKAANMADETVKEASQGLFRLIKSHEFLEIAPSCANKGETVNYLLSHYPWPGSIPLYLGDDDRDEEAFGMIKSKDGIAILVSANQRYTQADYRLLSPQVVHRFLETVTNRLALLDPRGESIC